MLSAFHAHRFWGRTGIINGSTASFYLNGKQDCTVSNVPSVVASPQDHLVAGATSSGANPWTGKIADLKLYGTSDGSAPGTDTDIKTNYDATADRYRETPVGNIVTNGLVLNLDAANAKLSGLTHYAPGCASTDFTWYDLSTSFLNGTLSNFASCSSSTGWNGDGTKTLNGTAGPYRLSFDGANDYVALGSNISLTGNLTIDTWFYPTNLNSSYQQIAGEGNGFNSTEGKLYIWNDNTLSFYASSTVSGSTLSANTWYHAAVTVSGTTATLYLNGSTNATGTINRPSSSSGIAFTLGKDPANSSQYFNGHIAATKVYNRALSASEINQNCKALKPRFSGATCN